MKRLMQRIRMRTKKNERGVALFIALFALLLLASIGMGMLFMANTETAVNYNYRDAQRTYFASQAGLELVRDAMRTNYNLIPQTMPAPGNPNGVIYITNPLPGEVVTPWIAGTPYFDSELCHEYDDELGIADPNAVHLALPCTNKIPPGSYTNASALVSIPYAGTADALNFKWVRVTLKANFSTPYRVDLGQPDASQVCWDDEGFRQHVINVAEGKPGNPLRAPSEFELAAFKQAIGVGLDTNAVFAFGAKGKSTTTTGSTTTGSTTTGSTTTGSTTTGSTTTGSTTTGSTTTGSTTTGSTTTGGGGGGYLSAIDACQASAQPQRFSVYLITSLAVSPTGSRRLTQFEISRYPFPPIPGGLTFNGPGANFVPADSNNFTIDGHDHATAGPTCSGPRPPIHGVTANGDASRTSLIKQIQNDGRPDHYLGLGNDQVTNAGPPSQSAAGQQYDYSTSPAPTPTEMLPDVADGSIVDPNDPTATTPVLDKFDTVDENEQLVTRFTDSADTLATGDINGADNLPLKNPDCLKNDWQMGTEDPSAPAACQGPKVTVVQGDFQVQNTKGVGILLVTGTLTIGGNFEWNGLILVIGDGQIVANGGGTRTVNGGIYVAQTKDPSTGALLPALGNPFVDWNGGGNNSLLYDSCKISNALQGSSFRVIAYREMTY
jgi:hypothetical protein